MPEATGSINRSNTICHYTRFFRFLESNCNGSNVGDPKMVELLHLFAENGLTPISGLETCPDWGAKSSGGVLFREYLLQRPQGATLQAGRPAGNISSWHRIF